MHDNDICIAYVPICTHMRLNTTSILYNII